MPTERLGTAIEIHNFPDVCRITKQLAECISDMVMDRMLALPGFRDSRAFKLIAFNELENVKADFGSGWVLADHSPAGISE